MENRYLLSIIIPVYNLEKYISRCLDSVVGYDELSLEILIIDDGSTDASPRICEEYAARYPQIRVIHKKNEGASVARNTGIKLALGTYLMFLDGDDFLETRVLNEISGQLDGETQIYTYHFYDYYEEDQKRVPVRHLVNFELYDKKGNISRDVFYSIPVLPMPWLYIIKRDYLLSNGLYMKAGMLDEDEEWSARLFARLRTAKVLNLYVYNYRRNRSASLTAGRSYDNIRADLAIIKLLIKEAHKKDYDRRQRHILYNKGRELLKRTIRESISLNPDQKKYVYNQQRRLRRVLVGGSRADKALYMLSLIFGMEKAMSFVKALVYRKRSLFKCLPRNKGSES